MAPNMDPNADVINSTATAEEQQAKMLNYLSSIESLLKNMASGNQSQSAARDMNNNNTGKGQSQKGTFSQQYDDFWRDAKNKRSSGFKSRSNGLFDSVLDPFLDSLEDSLIEGVLGSDYKKRISNVMKDFADQIGIDLKDIPAQFGKRIGQMGMDAFKQTGMGQRMTERVSSVRNWAMGQMEGSAAQWRRVLGTQPRGKYKNAPSTSGQSTGDTIRDQAGDIIRDKAGDVIRDKVGGKLKDKALTTIGKTKVGGKIAPWAAKLFGSGAAGAGGTAAAGAGAGAGAGTAAAGTAIKGGAAFGPWGVVIAIAAVILVAKTLKALGPAIEGTKKMFEALKKAGNRYIDSRKKNIELEKKRLEDDVRTLIETPFKILEESAEKVEQVWDNNLRKITATQGYSKADLQDLMAVFAERVRSEGLSSVVSAADITDNLAKVLESGLAGPVAEEFAYIATKLNAAIPTQDFFGYASTYASIVANAVKNGQSQAEAVEAANSAIQTYASSILYASRQLTGGVTTGLQNAQSLFDEAVKIVQASRTGDVNQIAGVLTSVSATIGAIAPDLASSLTDVVVQAAIGGNTDQLVALRSLAGINASNTEFLRQIATDPQSVFVALFDNLGRMQKMSEGAYMEVAEGLSNVFGVSLEALARVDFNYLAQSISGMSVNNASLDENMKLLASGQTTLTAEQLRTQQINKYIIDEGLSMVLDNEAARLIQQHMWEEQMNRELMEATYSVELKGAALEFLEGIKQTVQNIINILNPFAWIGKLVNMAATAVEGYALESDIAQVLTLGRVGKGAMTASEMLSLYNLTTRGQDLHLTSPLVNLMGGQSAYQIAHAGTQLWNMFNPSTALLSAMDLQQGIWSTLTSPALSMGIGNALAGMLVGGRVGSRYTWGGLRKSTAQAVSGLWSGTGVVNGAAAVSTSTQQSSVVDRLNKMLDKSVIDSFVKAGKGYDEWAATASQYGIRDLKAALDEAGYTQQQIEAYFEQQQTQQGQEQQQAVKQDEQDFRDKGRDFWISQLERMDTTIESIDVTNSLLTAILDGQTDFYQSRFAKWSKSWDSFYTKWVNYFVENAYYNERTGLDYGQIRAQEHAESQGAIYALAEAFNQGVADISDPTVQTNALLSKILLVCSSIMQQNATKAGGSSLADTLNALALGITV